MRSPPSLGVNEFGFIETPYRKVVSGKVTGEIVYMAADEEEEYVVAQANTPINADGTFKVDKRPRAPFAAGPPASSDLKQDAGAESFFGATTDIGVREAGTRSTTWTSRRSRSCRSRPRSSRSSSTTTPTAP